MPRWILVLALLLSACNLTQTVPPTVESLPLGTPVVTVPDAAPCPVVAGTPTLETPPNFMDYASAIETFLSAGGDTAHTLPANLAVRSLIYTADQAEGFIELPGGGGVWTADFTGDGVDDVLVNISQAGVDGAPADTALWLYACEGSAYRQVAEITYQPMVFMGFATGVNATYFQDMNNDMRLDIVYHIGECGAHTCYNTVDVVTWDDASQTLVSLMAEPANFPHGGYRIEGCCQLVVETGAISSVGAGPQRTHTWTYGWDGTRIVRTSDIVNQPPTFRFEAAQDATAALDAGDYDAALALYDRVLNDTSLQEFSIWSPDDTRMSVVLRTQALFGTMIITAAQQGIDAAQSAYDELMASPNVPAYDINPEGESVWLGLGRIFWDTAQSSGDLSAACAAVGAEVDSRLAVNMFDVLYWGDYGYANAAPTGEQVCPL